MKQEETEIISSLPWPGWYLLVLQDSDGGLILLFMCWQRRCRVYYVMSNVSPICNIPHGITRLPSDAQLLIFQWQLLIKLFVSPISDYQETGKEDCTNSWLSWPLQKVERGNYCGLAECSGFYCYYFNFLWPILNCDTTQLFVSVRVTKNVWSYCIATTNYLDIFLPLKYCPSVETFPFFGLLLEIQINEMVVWRGLLWLSKNWSNIPIDQKCLLGHKY